MAPASRRLLQETGRKRHQSPELRAELDVVSDHFSIRRESGLLPDRLLAGLPGIAATKISRVQTAVEPADLRRAAAVVRLTPGRRVFVACVGVPEPQLIPVVVAEID